MLVWTLTNDTVHSGTIAQLGHAINLSDYSGPAVSRVYETVNGALVELETKLTMQYTPNDTFAHKLEVTITTGEQLTASWVEHLTNQRIEI